MRGARSRRETGLVALVDDEVLRRHVQGTSCPGLGLGTHAPDIFRRVLVGAALVTASETSRSPWSTICVWVSWWTATLTWAKRLAEPTLATRC